MKKVISSSAALTKNDVKSLKEISVSLRSIGTTPQVIENPIYGCGSCAGWSSGKGVCEGNTKKE